MDTRRQGGRAEGKGSTLQDSEVQGPEVQGPEVQGPEVQGPEVQGPQARSSVGCRPSRSLKSEAISGAASAVADAAADEAMARHVITAARNASSGGSTGAHPDPSRDEPDGRDLQWDPRWGALDALDRVHEGVMKVSNALHTGGASHIHCADNS